jgi:hypothetical protein
MLRLIAPFHDPSLVQGCLTTGESHRPSKELGGKRANLNGGVEHKSVELVSRILISRNDWLVFFLAVVFAHRLNRGPGPP